MIDDNCGTYFRFYSYYVVFVFLVVPKYSSHGRYLGLDTSHLTQKRNVTHLMGDVYFLSYFLNFNTVIEATSSMMWLTIKYVNLFYDLHHPHINLVVDQPPLVGSLMTHCGVRSYLHFRGE